MRRDLRFRRCGAGLVALAALLAAPASFAAPRRLAIVLAPRTADVGAVSARLAGRGFRLGPELWSNARLAMRIADPTADPTTSEVYRAIEVVRQMNGVIAAGELLAEDARRVRFYSGRVLVRFRRPLDDAAARSWGARLSLTLVERVEADSFLFDAQLDPSRLLALVTSGLPEEVLPVVHDLGPDPGQTPVNAVYQRIPPGRNLLAVLLEVSPPPASYDNVLQQHGGVVIVGLGKKRHVVRFPHEAAMMQAQTALRALPFVHRTGPVVSIEPLAFLTEQLVVRFASGFALQQAAPLLAAHLLQPVRSLPWSERTFLYRLPQPTYEIYDAARDLIDEGFAVAALPNLVTVLGSACGEDSCVDATDSQHDHQEYLRQLDLCDVWELSAVNTSPVVLGVLDTGIQANTATEPGVRLAVGTVIDLDTMELCQPAVASNWSSECSAVLSGWTDAHGINVALLAAADHDDEDLLGIAPAAKLINAKQPTDGLISEVALADALWWLAGGDPDWCRDGTNYGCTVGSPPDGNPCANPLVCDGATLPAGLDDTHRADVINLSFWRADFLEEEICPPAICQPVCASSANCWMIDNVLERIRHPMSIDVGVRVGGAVVVAAVGIDATDENGSQRGALCYDSAHVPQGNLPLWDLHTDLAESPWTVAVGSVNREGEPFEPDLSKNDCLIQFSGPFLDVVAPLGGTDGTTLCSECGQGEGFLFGESSAATAAVSGIAALMLRHNATLTADQVHCLLRETADPREWGDLSGWFVPGCDFIGGHSPCMGYGMADACAAVDAALACGDPQASCICPGPGGPPSPPTPPDPPQGLHRTDILLEARYARGPMRLRRELINDAIRCSADPHCNCGPAFEECMRFRIRNGFGRRLERVEFKLCSGEECWELPSTLRTWKPGEDAVVPFVPRSEPLFWSRATGEPLEIRVFSRGRQVGP